MKVYINRQPVPGPWGGGNMFFRAAHSMIPEMGHELADVIPDVYNPVNAILLTALGQDGTNMTGDAAIMHKMWVPNTKIILRVNECDARKGTTGVDVELIKFSKHLDATVFVSSWLHDYFMDKGWACEDNCVIKNGVDREIFKAQPKLNNGKLNIVAHHWSNNRLKGFDVYEELDAFVGQNPDRFTFTYIGRDAKTFKHTKVIEPLFGKKLGEELGKYDVYVSASRFDPGPNHILEAISCELPTFVHKDGGGCVEFADKSGVYKDWRDLKSWLMKGRYPTIASRPDEWKPCIKEYIDFLEQTCQKTS